MPKFLTTDDIVSEISTVIKKAQKEIFLVSPYLQFPKTISDRLLEADSRNIPITIICRVDSLSNDTNSFFQKFNNLRVYSLENLHAKCYFNESQCVLTSMNLYDFSKDNWEMGILITQKQDTAIFKEIKSEVEVLKKSADYWFGPEEEIDALINKNSNPNGICIRCGIDIELDPDRPYCNSCFKSWAYWENPNFQEKHCHVCGNSFPATMNRPVCRSCF